MHHRRALRFAFAALAAGGVLAAFAMLAIAAPNVAQRSAAGSVYCLPSEKANRKTQLEQAKSVNAAAAASEGNAAVAAANSRNAVNDLVVRQAKAKKAYFKTHRSVTSRARFLTAQHKALANAKSALAAAITAYGAAQRAATAARTAQVSAQAAYDQCN